MAVHFAVNEKYPSSSLGVGANKNGTLAQLVEQETENLRVPCSIHGRTTKMKLTYYCDNARHLVCVPYSIENLHIMAEDLGIKRCWFHANYPHYDIPKKRVAEISAKCNVVSSKEILKIVKGKV